MFFNLKGILGTLIFHLAIVVIFLTIKVTSVFRDLETVVVMEIEEDEQEDEFNIDESERKEIQDAVEQFFAGTRRRNIGVNVSDDFKENISTKNYLENFLKESNIKDLDNQRAKDLLSESEEEYPQLQEEKSKSEEEDTKYFGPTNIYYDLKGRNHLYLPVPVYKCEGHGLVVVGIVVDQKGYVVHTKIDQEKSEINEECLQEAAIKAALKSRFNADFNAELRQQGSISYIFVAQ